MSTPSTIRKPFNTNQKLADVRATNISRCDFSDTDDVDGAEASTVASGHIGVASLDGDGAGEFSVLFVHVMGTRARIVADPDTKVLDGGRSLFRNLVVIIK